MLKEREGEVRWKVGETGSHPLFSLQNAKCMFLGGDPQTKKLPDIDFLLVATAQHATKNHLRLCVLLLGAR